MKLQTKITGWTLCAGLTLIACLWPVGAAPRKTNSTTKPMAAASSATLKQFIKQLEKVNKGQIDKREDQDLGFGARRLHLAIYPDASYWITVVAVDERVAALNISYSGGISSESWGRLTQALQASGLPAPHEEVAGAFGYYSFEDKTLLARLDKKVAAELGAKTAATIPKTLQSSYTALTSPLSRLRFGTLCGEGAEKPAGRVAVETLIRAKRTDLLGNVLRSGNPEGRVYAAEALLSLAKQGVALRAADATAIARIKASPILINACSGCLPQSATAARLLEGDRWQDA